MTYRIKREKVQDPIIVPGQALHTSRHGEGGWHKLLSGEKLEKLLPEVKYGSVHHLVSCADWSMHDLLCHLLSLTGPANVWLTSWAISEGPVREMVNMRLKGQITQLKCVFDSRIKSQCPAAAQLIDRNFDIVALADIHAKVIAIVNEKHWISVTSTANLTNKRRVEKYVICADIESALFDSGWIEGLIKTGHKWN